MRHSFDLRPADERRLAELARQAGMSEDELIERAVSELLSDQPAQRSRHVTVSAGVMGGDACIRDTRIPVWLLVQCKRAGMTDGDILQAYPSLSVFDLVAAWDYFASHTEEVERQLREHAEAV